MATFNQSRFTTGDIYGVHDVGYTAWLIRWKSAGWGKRNDMNVWVHCGIILKKAIHASLPYDLTCAEMLGSGYAHSNATTKYLNKPSDNPGLRSLIRPWVYSRIAGNLPQLYLIGLCLELIKNPAKYDWGNLISGMLNLTSVFDGDASYICNEAVWHLTCGVEKTFGLRFLGNGRGLSTGLPGGMTDYVPYLWSPEYTSWGNSRFAWNYSLNMCAWNKAYSSDIISPYTMETMRGALCGGYQKSYFWGA